VLLACAPDEQHSLPLDVLAAALAEKGSAVRNLGARVPAAALVSAARRLAPRVVFVWAHHRAYADQVPLAEMDDRVLVGGPGWDDVPLPGGVLRVDTLTGAVETILNRI
jgi:methylmalonyl-CoA mutase cobalamin-binding subunit